MNRPATRSSPPAARIAWVIAAAGTAMVATLLASYASQAADASAAQIVAVLSLLIGMLAFVLCGALIVSRQPRNIVGWLLMIPGLVLPASTLVTNWLGSMPAPQQVSPLLWLLLWSLGWSWLLLIFPILHLLLTFPDGRLISRRWRWAVALEVAMVAIFLGFTALEQDLRVLVDDEVAWTIANPIGVLPNDMFDEWLAVPWEIGLVVITVASAAAVVVRFRRGSTVEREQLKWPLLAVVVFGAVYAGSALEASLVGDASILFGLALAGIPISVAIAVLRYRLFAIDHIISRTVSWAAVTAILLGVFIVGVLGLQALFSGVTQGQTLAVAASTLVSFALFQPVRRRVQRAVDRRFDRARYDAERIVGGFSERLRGEVELRAVEDELVATVGGVLRPTGVAIWLRRAGWRP
jgi:hypothetical protein